MVQRLYTPAGDRRQKIDLLDPQGAPRAGDGSFAAPTTFKSGLWAKVELLQGHELLKAQQIVQEVTHRVTIRYLSGVLARMVVVLRDGRRFQIQAVQDPDERKWEMRLLCVERNDGQS